MIIRVVFNFFLLITLCCNVNALPPVDELSGMTVNINLPDNYMKDYLRIECFSANSRSFDNQAIVFNEKIKTASFKKKFNFNYVIFCSVKGLNNDNMFWLMEPGDDVTISYVNNNLVFSGPEKDKLELQYNIRRIKDSIQKNPSGNNYNVQSLSEYLAYSKALDCQLKLIIPIIDGAKSKLSDSAYNLIRVQFIRDVEDERYEKFIGLRAIAAKIGLSNTDISTIFDTTLCSKDAIWMQSMPYSNVVNIGYVKNKVLRNYNFNLKEKKLRDKSARKLLYYNEGKNTYQGFALETFNARLIARDVIQDIGFDEVSESLLKLYYEDSRDSIYKAYVREIEFSARKLNDGMPAPRFELIGEKGEGVSLSDFKGKVVVLDFWFTGCLGCQQIAPVLRKVEKFFKGDTNLVFLSVSIDQKRSRWLESLKSRTYSSESAINVFTGGLADRHDIVNKYMVNSYPSLFLIDGQGNIVRNPLEDPRKDSGAGLVALIGRELVLLTDGPYLIDTSQLYYFRGNSVIHERIDRSKKTELSCASDQYGVQFKFTLKSNLDVEPCIYQQADKMFIVSDIEGNFGQFRKLLVNNGIIDNSNNWTFGNGHLVVCGDVFDRGEQVTECLWFIYMLEERARLNNGKVHFILGNHEIMNLNANNAYSRGKYQNIKQKIGLSYPQLFDNKSELGKWLRTKNIVEKIGDVLVVHGGISPQVMKYQMSINEMNDLAREYYDKDSVVSYMKDGRLSILYDKEDSPFWYRKYYLDKDKKIIVGGRKGIDTIYRTPLQDVKSTLERFDVRSIVTGHTIIGKGDKLTVHYDGMVINTDTNHAKGESEGLLIENGKFFRGGTTGKRISLDISAMPEDVLEKPQ